MGNRIGAAHDPSVADDRADLPALRAGRNMITTVITGALVWNARRKAWSATPKSGTNSACSIGR